jgi:uncharacterized protein YndB with AHSA1/START domain
MSTVSDCIEKKITLRAPVSRVWRAISDAREFGVWFGVELEGSFKPGERSIGKIKPTQVDEAVAKLQKPHEGKRFEFFVERVEPERRFAFRWHPFAIDPAVDYSKEPTTLVEFELAAVEGGTLLTIRESGFDGIPIDRRRAAFEANEGGWEHQARLVQKYVERPGA